MAKASEFDRPFRRDFELAEDMDQHEGVYVVDETGSKIRGVRGLPFVVPEEIGDRSYLSMDRVLDTPVDRGTLVLLYRDDDGSSDLWIVAISIDGSGITTHGTPVQVTSYTSSSGEVTKIADGKFAVVYLNSSNYAEAVVGTVSGTTITLGTPLTLDSTGTCAWLDICELQTDEFVSVHRTGFGPSGVANYCTVSGTTITLADQSTFYAGTTSYCKVARLENAKFAVLYNLSSTPWVRAATISLGLISWGTAGRIYRGSQYIQDVTEVGTNNLIIGGFKSTFNLGAVRPIMFSGTTPSLGTSTSLSGATFNELDLDEYEDKPGYFNCFYNRSGSGYYRRNCRVGFPSILLGTEMELTKANPSHLEVCGLEDEEVFLAWHQAADSETWTYLVSDEYELTVARIIGVLEETGTTGQTKTVTLLGGVYQEQTGMTPGAYWYINVSTGLLTSTIGDYKIGIAIDSDRLKLLFPDQDYGP